MPSIVARIQVVAILAPKAGVDAALLIKSYYAAVGFSRAGLFGQAFHHPFWVARAGVVANDKVFTKDVGSVEGRQADLGPFVEVVCLVLGLGVGVGNVSACFLVVLGKRRSEKDRQAASDQRSCRGGGSPSRTRKDGCHFDFAPLWSVVCGGGRGRREVTRTRR